MSEVLGKFKEEYKNIKKIEQNCKNYIYTGYNIKYKRNVTLIIFNKEKFNDNKKLKEKLNKEMSMVNKFGSDNILNIFRILENDTNFIYYKGIL